MTTKPNLDGTTHFATLESEIRRLANSCDLKGFNAELFLKSTFVSDIAQYVQQKEAEAYQRGLSSPSSK